MATIEKRNGKYRVKVRQKGQKPATATFPTKKLAEHWAAQTELQIITGRYFGLAYTKTFGDLVEHYRTRAQPLAHEESTIAASQSVLKFWVEQFGERYLANVRKADVLDGRDTLVSQGKKPSTVNRYVATLSAVFSHGVERDWLEVNPCHRIKRLKDNANRGRVLTQEEELRLLYNSAAWGNGYSMAIVKFALATGARLSEIENLTYADIDGPRRTVTFRNTKNGEDRTIPVSQSLLHELPMRDETRHQHPFSFHRTVWDIAVVKAGLKGFRFHDLRHTFITRAIERGVSPAKVAAYVGHKTLTMTAKYTHLDTRDLGDVVA